MGKNIERGVSVQSLGFFGWGKGSFCNSYLFETFRCFIAFLCPFLRAKGTQSNSKKHLPIRPILPVLIVAIFCRNSEIHGGVNFF